MVYLGQTADAVIETAVLSSEVLVVGLIVTSVFFGIILGPLARLILPGRQAIGIVWTVVGGFIGALLGGIVANGIGLSDTEDNIDWLRILIQLICAVVAVAVIAARVPKR